MRALSRASAASSPFWTMILAIFGFSSRKLFRASPTAELTIPSDFAVSQLGLGLAFELGLGNAEREDGGQPFAEPIAGGDDLLEEPSSP